MVAYTNYLTDARPRREAEALAARGDKVDFLALREEGRPSTERIEGVGVVRVMMERYRGGSTLLYIGNYVLFFLLATFKTAFLFVKYRYDVIYVHTMPDFMVFAASIPKTFGAKVVLDMHDTMPELYMSKFGLGDRHFLIRLVAFQERLSANFADRIVCVHHPHRDVLVNRGIDRQKATILMNLPDPRIFDNNQHTSPVQRGHVRLVYHGTVARRLGLDLAIEAFSKVLHTFPHARFDIFGDGDFADQLEENIHRLNIDRSVYFSRKFFRVDEIPTLLRGATVGVIANRKDLATKYMLPVKLLEYVYLGIPVVAPRLQTICYYFPEDCIAYFEPEHADELAAALVRLHSDKGERERLMSRSKAFFNEYSWERMRENLFSVVDH